MPRLLESIIDFNLWWDLNCLLFHQISCIIGSSATLQMFTGIYRDSAGKSEYRDFKFMGIACIPAIPVI